MGEAKNIYFTCLNIVTFHDGRTHNTKLFWFELMNKETKLTSCSLSKCSVQFYLSAFVCGPADKLLKPLRPSARPACQGLQHSVSCSNKPGTQDGGYRPFFSCSRFSSTFG